MKMWRGFWFFLGVVLLSSCSVSVDEDGFYLFSYSADFSLSQDDWTGDFAEYPVDKEDSAAYQLQFAYTDLPANLGAGKKGLMLSGMNPDQDLFMFIKKKISGLAPNQLYTIVFDISLASNAPTGSSGVEGSPGEGVVLKVGATNVEPKKVVNGDAYAINIDKGEGIHDGEDMIAIGNIGVAANTTSYTSINRNNVAGEGIKAWTNNKGELWLIIGTDSAFKGNTTLFYTNVDAVLSSSN